MSDDDPAEYGRRLAEQSAAKLDPTSVAQSAAAIALFSDIYQLLVEKQVLTQGDAVSRLEKVSNAIMASDTERREPMPSLWSTLFEMLLRARPSASRPS